MFGHETNRLVGIGSLEVLVEAGHFLGSANNDDLVDVTIVHVGLVDGLLDVSQRPVVDVLAERARDELFVEHELVAWRGAALLSTSR